MKGSGEGVGRIRWSGLAGAIPVRHIPASRTRSNRPSTTGCGPIVRERGRSSQPRGNFVEEIVEPRARTVGTLRHVCCHHRLPHGFDGHGASHPGRQGRRRLAYPCSQLASCLRYPVRGAAPSRGPPRLTFPHATPRARESSTPPTQALGIPGVRAIASSTGLSPSLARPGPEMTACDARDGLGANPVCPSEVTDLQRPPPADELLSPQVAKRLALETGIEPTARALDECHPGQRSARGVGVVPGFEAVAGSSD